MMMSEPESRRPTEDVAAAIGMVGPSHMAAPPPPDSSATRAAELGRSLGGRAPEDTPMNCASCGYSFLVDERAALARGRLGACPECGADSILLERR